MCVCARSLFRFAIARTSTRADHRRYRCIRILDNALCGAREDIASFMRTFLLPLTHLDAVYC